MEQKQITDLYIYTILLNTKSLIGNNITEEQEEQIKKIIRTLKSTLKYGNKSLTRKREKK